MKTLNWILIILFISIPLFNCQNFPPSMEDLFTELDLPPELQQQIEEAQSNLQVKAPAIPPELTAYLWKEIIQTSSLKELILEGKLKKFLDPGVSNETGGIFKGIQNELCVNHTRAFFKELTLPLGEIMASNGTRPATWAIQMIDAWGGIPDGSLSGHTSSTGDFEECLQIRGNVDGWEDQGQGSNEFKGLYCLNSMVPKFNTESTNRITDNPIFLKLYEQFKHSGNTREVLSPAEFLAMLMQNYQLRPRKGTCLPSSCTRGDVSKLFRNTFAALNIDFVRQSPQGCYTDDKPDFDASTIAFSCLLALIVLLCIVGTLVDLLLLKNAKPGSALRGNGIKALVAFSLYTNTLKLMNTDSGKDSLGCLHGLRFWSMAWVILGHTWLILFMGIYQESWNMVDVVNMYKSNISIMAIMNLTCSVDTFFVISGTLAAYNILHLLDKTRGRVNVPLIYLHRYLRLTPTYMFLLGIMATLLPYAGTGPTGNLFSTESEQCRKWWWHNLLYITNVVDLPRGESGCYGESWYLSSDMQFFLLSPILLYPLWRWKRFGLGFLGLCHAASVIVPTVIKSRNDLIPTVILTINPGKYNDLLYFKPWARIGPYIVGLTLGYILNEQSKSSEKSNRRVVTPLWVKIGWVICTATSLAIIFGIKRFMDPANQVETHTSVLSDIYGGFHRYFWGVCIAWIIYACVNGYGGWINDFLSWKPFIPLSRLTFCVYLSSLTVQHFFHMRTFHALHYSTYMGISIFFVHLVTALMVGFVLSLTLESPFLQLEKLIFPQRKSRDEKTKQELVDSLPVTLTGSTNPDLSPHGMKIENGKGI